MPDKIAKNFVHAVVISAGCGFVQQHYQRLILGTQSEKMQNRGYLVLYNIVLL